MATPPLGWVHGGKTSVSGKGLGGVIPKGTQTSWYDRKGGKVQDGGREGSSKEWVLTGNGL